MKTSLKDIQIGDKVLYFDVIDNLDVILEVRTVTGVSPHYDRVDVENYHGGIPRNQILTKEDLMKYIHEMGE